MVAGCMLFPKLQSPYVFSLCPAPGTSAGFDGHGSPRRSYLGGQVTCFLVSIGAHLHLYPRGAHFIIGGDGTHRGAFDARREVTDHACGMVMRTDFFFSGLCAAGQSQRLELLSCLAASATGTGCDRCWQQNHVCSLFLLLRSSEFRRLSTMISPCWTARLVPQRPEDGIFSSRESS